MLGIDNKSDAIEISSGTYDDGCEHESGSWDELKNRVDGIKWLVKRWIPYQMLAGVVAEPKAGKSAFVLGALVKPVITGGPWFNLQSGRGEPGYVVWCDTERRAAVNLERAVKWKLPVENIKTPFSDVTAVIDLEDDSHIQRISDVVCRYKASLVVVDSFRGAHKGDENSSKMATVLQQLGSICENTNCACVVIHHAKKLSVDEEMNINVGRGSNAFLAMVACQLVIDTPDPKADKKNPWRRVQMLGENLGSAPTPIGFRFNDTGLEYGPAPTRAKKETKQGDAEKILIGLMKPDQWYPSKEVEEAATRFGLSESAVQRAREALGVKASKAGGIWRMMLPAQPGA